MFPEDEQPGFSVERALPVPVQAAWSAMEGVIGAQLVQVGGRHSFSLDDWHLTERTTVSEAPTRRVYEIVSGAPVRRYVGTTTFTSSGAGSVLRWRVAVEPGEEAYEAFLARAERAVTRGVELIVAAATSGRTTGGDRRLR